MSFEFAESGIAGGVPETSSRSNLLARFVRRFGARRRHRRQMQELLSMDSRLLADIGLTQAQAQYLATQPYAGDWSGAFVGRRNNHERGSR